MLFAKDGAFFTPALSGDFDDGFSVIKLSFVMSRISMHKKNRSEIIGKRII